VIFVVTYVSEICTEFCPVIHESCHVKFADVDWFVFRKWSGARDLNPGPHGPEPSWLHFLGCPGGSARALLISNAASLLSSCDLLVPAGSRNA